MKPEIWISEEVENYFAASPFGPLLEVSEVASDDDHPVSYSLRESLTLVPGEVIEAVIIDDHFQGLYGNLDQTGQECFAREWAVIEELHRRIRKRRRAYLLTQYTESRPTPYDEPELADLTVSEDRLVPLSEFEIDESVLVRNGRAYSILPPTPSENSSYWITRALLTEGLKDYTWVRLDPLIHGPADTFPKMFYRMLWWGPPLLWDDVMNIKEESFGRWVPASLSNRSDFTDFAWVPRGDELSLYLEEMPRREDLNITGSRYFHVIFSRKTERVIHLDGAIRIYSETEWEQRKNVPVHRTKKVGVRIKVFRIDEPIQSGAVSNIGGTYFVWNNDISYFFGASVPKQLLGKAE